MKRLASLALSLMMLLTLTVPIAHAAETKPTPPSWIKAADYVVFPGDEVYQSENWAKILKLRRSAERGDPIPAEQLQTPDKTASIGTCFELGLIRFRYAVNSMSKEAFAASESAFAHSQSRYNRSKQYKWDQTTALIALWNGRGHAYTLTNFGEMGRGIANVLNWLKRGENALFDFQYADKIPAENRVLLEQQIRAAFHPAPVYLDGSRLEFSGPQPEITDGRTMIPLPKFAERTGAIPFSYNEASGQISITKDARTITMTIGKTTAHVNGTPVEVSSAPYDVVGYPMVPLRDVGILLDQTVFWDPEKKGAVVQENKSVAATSNLEAWALPMSAVLSYLDQGDITWFGLWRRGSTFSGGGGYVVEAPLSGTGLARMILEDSWAITERKQLIQTAVGLSQQSRSASCFDLFRVSSLAQWGYEAGYLTYAEALALIEPAAQRLRESFTSWDAAYENYLKGYYSWLGEGLGKQSVWETERGKIYKNLKATDAGKALFNDQLFKTPVKGVPGVTAEQLLSSIQ